MMKKKIDPLYHPEVLFEGGSLSLGRISTNAEVNLVKTLQKTITMMEECKILFATMDTRSTRN